MNISQTIFSFRDNKTASFPFRVNDSDDFITTNNEKHRCNIFTSNAKTPLNNNNNEIKKHDSSLFELEYKQPSLDSNNVINDNLFYTFKDSGVNNNKLRIKFQTNIFIPEPFMEQQINAKIRDMNMNKEQKEKYFLETKEMCDKINLVRDKIMLKPNERRRHLKRKIMLEIKNKEESNETLKTGRKKKSDGTIRFHNKYSLDNLFNKAKNMINKSLIEFINILINAIYSKEQIKRMFLELNIEKKKSNPKLMKVIKDNQYDFIKDKKKSSDILKLLTFTVKEYLCNELSTKYTNLPNDYNEKVIEWILKDDNNKIIFDFIFNKLKIEDWVDIFLYNKKLKDCYFFNSLDLATQKIIKENIIGIDYYFEEIYSDNKGNIDKDYFHCLLLLIYNLRRYILIKEKRNCPKK